MRNNICQDHNCRIKTEVEAVLKHFSKMQTALKISACPLVFVKCVYIREKTQQLSYVKAIDASKSQQQQQELNC